MGVDVLRNDLIVLLSQHDNDNVAVNINGVLVDVDAVMVDQGNIVVIPYVDDMREALRNIASGATPLVGGPTGLIP